MLIVFERLLWDFFWHLLYFPLWWYSQGLFYAAKMARRVFQQGNALLAPGLWLKNIFVPMYGQTDWQGKLMSFFVRLANVVIRAGLLFFWLMLSLVLFMAWPVFPIAVVYMLTKAL